jgi:hypothetical protein
MIVTQVSLYGYFWGSSSKLFKYRQLLMMSATLTRPFLALVRERSTPPRRL